MRPVWLLLGSVVLALLGLAIEGTATDKAAEKPTAKNADLPAFTSEREASALQFVKEHHAELLGVLERVKGLNRSQYELAIRQLFQEADRLALVKEHDEALYGIILESWKVKSRSEVLAARLAHAKEERGELEKELKDLLYRQVDLHRLQIEHNHRRALATLRTMEANIKLLQDKRGEIAERRFRTLTGRKGPR